MAKETAKYLTRDDVIKIVDDKNGELYKVFNKLIQDVDGLKSSQKRIERALLGDKDFEDIGIAKKVGIAYKHAVEVDGVVEKLDPVIAHYNHYNKTKMWELLEEMVDRYKIIKWLTALIVGSGIVSVANVVSMVIEFIQNAK